MVPAPERGMRFALAEAELKQSDLLDPTKNFLVNGSLMLEAHVQLTIGSREPKHALAINKAVLHDYSTLLSNPVYSDFTLIAQKDAQEFPVHRGIVAVRAPAMAAAIFNSKESEAGKFSIHGMEGRILAALLEFVYSGSLRQVCPDTAEALLVAADQYKLLDLEGACVGSIMSVITTESAARLLVLADTNNLKRLKSAVIKYLKQGHLPAFVENGGPKELQLHQEEGWRLMEEIMSGW